MIAVSTMARGAQGDIACRPVRQLLQTAGDNEETGGRVWGRERIRQRRRQETEVPEDYGQHAAGIW